MEEKEIDLNAGNTQGTAPETNATSDTKGENQPIVNGENKATPSSSTSDAFTQEQVNSIVRERLERDRKNVYDKLGVSDEQGLDSLIEKLKNYDSLSSDNASLREKVLFYENSILPNREDDIRYYFKGKGLELNQDTLKSALETHPEWVKAKVVDEQPKSTTIVPVGSVQSEQPKESEEDMAAKLFGLDHFVK